MEARRRAIGIGLILVSAAGFGSGTVLARPIYDTGIDWLELLIWRFIIGASLAWVWVLLSAPRRRAARQLTRRQVAVTLGLGSLYTGNAGTYYAGLQTVPAALAGVLVYTYPVIVAILSLRFATRLSGRRPYLALALAIVGVVLALGGIDVSGAPPPLLGIGLIMLSPVIYAVWIILSARLSGERRDRVGSEADDAGDDEAAAGDAAATTAVMMTATAVVFSLLGVLTGRPPDPTAIPA